VVQPFWVLVMEFGQAAAGKGAETPWTAATYEDVDEDIDVMEVLPAKGSASARLLLDKNGDWESELTEDEKALASAWTSPVGRCAPILGIDAYEALLALSPAQDDDVDLTASVLRARTVAKDEAQKNPAGVARRLVQVRLLASKRKGKVGSPPSATIISAAWPLMAFLAATRNALPKSPYGGQQELVLTKTPAHLLKRETARWVQRNAVALHADILLVVQGIAHGGGKRARDLTLFGGVAAPQRGSGPGIASREPDRALLVVLRRPRSQAWSAVTYSIAGSGADGVDRDHLPFASGAHLDRVLKRKGNEMLACFFEEARHIRNGTMKVAGTGLPVSVAVDTAHIRDDDE
jgi:hypothetical protein